MKHTANAESTGLDWKGPFRFYSQKSDWTAAEIREMAYLVIIASFTRSRDGPGVETFPDEWPLRVCKNGRDVLCSCVLRSDHPRCKLTRQVLNDSGQPSLPNLVAEDTEVAVGL